MALSNIEKHYNKHPEDLRLQRRHGIVEFETTMHHLRRFIKPDSFLLDIGAGTGRYTSALMAEGYRVKAVSVARTSNRSPGARPSIACFILRIGPGHCMPHASTLTTVFPPSHTDVSHEWL